MKGTPAGRTTERATGRTTNGAAGIMVRDRGRQLLKTLAVALAAALVFAAAFLLAGKRHDQNLHCWTTTNHQFIRAPGCVQK